MVIMDVVSYYYFGSLIALFGDGEGAFKSDNSRRQLSIVLIAKSL